jgi:aminoglycoside phosphotransferase (APT) family kinase protein
VSPHPRRWCDTESTISITPDPDLVAALAENLHLRETPQLVAPGIDRVTIAVSVCRAITTDVPVVLRQSSGTTVLATLEHVVRVARSMRSRLDVTQITDAAVALRAANVATTEPLARIVVSDSESDVTGANTWEVSVWRKYRNDAAPSWRRLGEVLQALHAVDPLTLGMLPPFTDTLDRGLRRVEHYDRELPGLLRRWEQLSSSLYASPARGLIHGDMTLSNILWGSDVILCDLEALCTGPREWDLAKIYETIVGTHGPAAFAEVLLGYQNTVDYPLLEACIAANLVKASTWRLEECDAGVMPTQRSELVATLTASIRGLLEGS